ncbi:hypothetical protein QR680_013969 [Steinernema hermaphroditum]|uniref:Interleukin-3 n=1 Tax=Steinernema hermaphroditum TaxID=289476 RepID=A0AA39I9K5_9BILA|nr:hypothetical protein QR680_013969 [Steinernema hermaphroditum]
MLGYASLYILLLTAVSAVPLRTERDMESSLKARNLFDLPADLQALIPSELFDYQNCVTDVTKKIKLELGRNSVSLTEIAASLKNNVISFTNCLRTVLDILLNKFYALGDEAKSFITDVYLPPFKKTGYLRTVPNDSEIMEIIDSLTKKYHALSNETKLELKTHFTNIAEFLERRLKEK